MFRTLQQTDLVELQENTIVSLYIQYQLSCRGRAVRLERFAPGVTIWEGA